MKNIYYVLTFLLCLSFNSIQAQEPTPISDSICVNENDLPMLSFDLTLNDLNPSGQLILQDPTMCWRIVGNNLVWTGSQNCRCGETYHAFYFYENNPYETAEIAITIKCDNPKPECFLNNLDDLPDPSAGQVSCLYACEFSTATYFVPHVLGNTYSWIINGHISYSTNPNGNQIDINWGPEGPGNITVIITNGGTTSFIDICVEILEGPVADFTKTADCICLEGSISFTNTSLGANSFLWDFGDSNTSINPNPTHTYTTPGTYKVVLWAYKNNQSPKGDPLCCCADSMSMYVTVEPGEGPNIYWVSTLCPGDKSYYWTDATNCGTYDWEVLDENGDLHPFTGDGNDTICVTWGGGPNGTISLSVADCDDPYCSKPTVVLVPIISAVSPIVGDVDVCENSTVTYTLPKWPNVYYDWTVTGGTVLPGDNGSNTVTIQWGSGPTGTIHVDYWSTFLGGLPGHNQADCAGVADLTVSILPPFSITGPTPGLACINSTSFFSATNAPWPNYNWTVSPAAPITGNGNANISIDWTSGPGTYVVTAMPTVPGHYCNDLKRYTMLVMETPVPDSISGPKKICPGETYIYFGHSSLPNTIMNWTVTGGTATSYTGSPITVTWNTTGPFSLSISQTMVSPPGCTSDDLICPIMEKVINGPVTFTAGPACINSQQMYNAGTIQDDDAVLEWKVSPDSSGSVIAGQGTIAPTVQWNNDPGSVTLTYCVTLCGVTQSHMETFMLNAPQVPTISQVGNLCPGGSAVLDASSGFASYLWSGPVVSTNEDITITVGGTYVLKTTDSNGCSATTSFDVIALPSPVASISTPDPRALCLPAAGQNVRLYAQTNPNYVFEWFCNGMSVQGPSPAAIFIHNGTNADSNFAYCVWVTDTSTTCRKKSNVLVVSQDTCGGPGNCNPQNYTFNIAASNPAPFCDVANFTVNNSGNVTLGGWNFGDPVNNTNTGSITNAQHAYSKAGYYTATLSGSVPNTVMPQPPAPPNCPVSASVSVCIPLAADFRYVEDCQEVCFTDLSTFLPGQNITIWDWNFGDGNFSALQDPCHVYSSPGTYTVKLTVENANNCMVMKQIMVTVLGPPSAAATIAPNPACVGDPISFMSTGSGIVDWLWDFDDMATNGAQNPSHTYLMLGSYNVTLIVTDINGCKDTSTTNVIVYPNPAADTISYSPSLVECEGTPIMLMAPAGPYIAYLWSNGQTNASINVTMAGDYHVTVTDGQGCKMVTNPVTVVFIPPPPVQITGPHFICDAGCVTLNATAGPGYNYQWLDAGMVPIPGAINPTYDVCDTVIFPASFFVHVIDANGCQSFAGPHFVDLVPSPSFTISTMGDLCAGSMNILTVVPVLPDVLYQWSTGEVGSSIIAVPAGTYTVIGLDTFTGCSHSESVIINPLPDLCIMPTGCYEVCNPDTLCGPDSMTAYQWNMNGTPIFGATSQCYIVSVSGSYSLTATNEFNCSATSDTLILEVIECTDCVDQEITAQAIQGDGCCYTLSYFNGIPNAYGLMMHTGDANITPDLGSLDPNLSVFTIGSNYIGLVANGGGNLPVGGLTGYLDFCLTNITNVPQVVIFDWYNDSLEIVCSDTLIFDCPVETDCIYITHDTIYCGPNNQVLYEFTVCNSVLNTFTFNYLTLVSSTPPGIVVSPNFFNLSPGLVPGSCTTLTVTLSGTNIANQEFCFNAIGHLSDPAVDPDALCCSLDSLQCIDIPGCSPCDKVYLETEQISDDPCCYAVQLNNNLDANTFTGIRICALTPGTGLTINNPFGSDWLTASFSPTVIDLVYNGSTTNLPLGSTLLPKICIDETTTPTQLIEIKWMQGTSIVCRDTFVAECEPPCGYIYNDSVYCTENNQWIFEGYIRNTSAHTMSTAVVSFVDASLTGYNQTIALGSLPPGGTFGPFFITIGAPATPGQVVCVDVILHEVGHNNEHENCCVFRHCFELPDCGGPKPCLCDQDFEEQVAAGFTCNPGADFQYFFSPLGNLMLCDKAVWTWDDGSPSTSVVGPTSVLHQFPGPGSYEVCITVYRTDDNGKKCKARYCKEVEIHQNQVNFSPNPAHGSVNLEWNVMQTGQANVRLYSPEHILVLDWQQEITDTKFEHSLNLNEVAPGLYFIIMELNGEQWIEKLMVY